FGVRGPILIDKYLLGRELDVDAVCDGDAVLIPGILEHIERAGVHSGDSFAVYPPITLSSEETQRVVEATRLIARLVKAVGLINIQFVLQEGIPYVLEVNPRASRTVLEGRRRPSGRAAKLARDPWARPDALRDRWNRAPAAGGRHPGDRRTETSGWTSKCGRCDPGGRCSTGCQHGVRGGAARR